MTDENAKTEIDEQDSAIPHIWEDGELATEKEVREALESVGRQAYEHGLADFAVDQMYEDARGGFRRYVKEDGEDGG